LDKSNRLLVLRSLEKEETAHDSSPGRNDPEPVIPNHKIEVFLPDEPGFNSGLAFRCQGALSAMKKVYARTRTPPGTGSFMPPKK